MNQKTSKDFRILAIALSYGGFGFVVMEGQKTIVEFGRRVADGDKNAQSLAKTKKLLNFYQPGVLVLQDVEAKGSRRYPRIKMLNRQIKRMAEKHKIEVKLISGKQLRDLLLGNSRGTKQEMAEVLATQFPDELASRLPPKRKPWKSEDSRMDIFDAMALAVVFRLKHVKSLGTKLVEPVTDNAGAVGSHNVAFKKAAQKGKVAVLK